ncbi:MAG TPA: TIGR03435 family protein [Bryobacteraceae bacterium]|nr:TIGR03435 family protein [Bryobacteraceae bacterium]
MKRLLRCTGLAVVLTIAAPAQTFDVSSVKPAAPGQKTSQMDGGPLPIGPFNRGNHEPGRLTWSNIWLKRMIQIAWDFPPDRISGPDWLDTSTYDVVATLPPDTTVDNFKLMVRNLLAERFHLALHRETKEVSGYVLTIARNGPKIRESKDSPPPSVTKAASRRDEAGQASNALMVTDDNGYPAPRPGNPIYPPGTLFEGAIRVNGVLRVTGLNEPMSKIADMLGRFAGMPVEDQTGLTGTYDVHLEYLPTTPDAPAANAADIADPAPNLADAVQAQLGLKLTPKKVPVEMLVIDRAEKVPTEN